MLQYVSGDMFKSNADCLINTVNCEGYMGKGIAYQVKCQFPETNEDYVKACKNETLHIGTLHYFVENGTTIINFPTKDKWRAPSKIDYIMIGLDELVKLLPKLSVNTIAIPPLGCGNGGLLWKDVKTLMEEKLVPLENKYDFLIYEPSNQKYIQKVEKSPKLSVSSLILIQLKAHLKKRNNLRLQKAAYFTNIYFSNDYFKFQKHKCGPYDHFIDIITKNIEEYQKFHNLNNMSEIYTSVYQTICSQKTSDTLKKFEKPIKNSTAFINNLTDDLDVEGTATIHFLLKTNGPLSKEKITKGFKNWSPDKAKRFSEQRIEKDIQFLEKQGLIFQNIIGEYECSIPQNDRVKME